jgi:hypothetical protein
MRFMVLVKANEDSEAGRLPTEQQLDAMGKFNEELVKAGMMLGGEGLHPSSKGTRVRKSNGKITVTDGPFAESKELIGGFCMLELRSLDEVLAFSDRFVSVLGGTCELDIRTVAEEGT